MKQKVGIMSNGRKALLQNFSRLDELWEYVNDPNKTKHRKSFEGNENVFDNSSFVGGLRNRNQVEEYLMKGWDEPIEQMKQLIKENINKIKVERKSYKHKTDVCGFAPIVANAIRGLPNSMINQIQNPRKQKIVQFLIETEYSWMTSKESVMNYFSKIVAYIAVLESEGYRCRIDTFMSFSKERDNKTFVGMQTTVKPENQLFDLKRMAFVVAHCGFFRSVGFVWQSILDTKEVPFIEHDAGAGLGQALNYWSSSNKKPVIDFVKGNTNNKVIYIPFGLDDSGIDKIFGKGGVVYENKVR